MELVCAMTEEDANRLQHLLKVIEEKTTEQHVHLEESGRRAMSLEDELRSAMESDECHRQVMQCYSELEAFIQQFDGDQQEGMRAYVRQKLQPVEAGVGSSSGASSGTEHGADAREKRKELVASVGHAFEEMEPLPPPNQQLVEPEPVTIKVESGPSQDDILFQMQTGFQQIMLMMTENHSELLNRINELEASVTTTTTTRMSDAVGNEEAAAAENEVNSSLVNEGSSRGGGSSPAPSEYDGDEESESIRPEPIQPATNDSDDDGSLFKVVPKTRNKATSATHHQIGGDSMRGFVVQEEANRQGLTSDTTSSTSTPTNLTFHATPSASADQTNNSSSAATATERCKRKRRTETELLVSSATSAVYLRQGLATTSASNSSSVRDNLRSRKTSPEKKPNSPAEPTSVGGHSKRKRRTEEELLLSSAGSAVYLRSNKKRHFN